MLCLLPSWLFSYTSPSFATEKEKKNLYYYNYLINLDGLDLNQIIKCQKFSSFLIKMVYEFLLRLKKSTYLSIFVTHGKFWQKQKTYRNFHRSIANGYVNTVKLNSPNLMKIYIYTYVFHHVYEFIELFMQPFGFFSKPPSSKYENRLFV